MYFNFTINVSVRYRSQENDEGTWKLSSMVVVNQTKEIRISNTKWTKYVRNVPQESITGRKMNGRINIHRSASTDHGFGCSRTLLVCTIQVQPSAWLLVDWICSGSGGGRRVAWVRRGGTSLLHMIPHRPKLSRDSLYTSFLCTSHWAQLYTVRTWLAVHQTFSVRNSRQSLNLSATLAVKSGSR